MNATLYIYLGYSDQKKSLEARLIFFYVVEEINECYIFISKTDN